MAVLVAAIERDGGNKAGIGCPSNGAATKPVSHSPLDVHGTHGPLHPTNGRRSRQARVPATATRLEQFNSAVPAASTTKSRNKAANQSAKGRRSVAAAASRKWSPDGRKEF